jgi:lysozyme
LFHSFLLSRSFFRSIRDIKITERKVKVNVANKWLVGTVSASLIASATLWEGTKYYAYKDIVGVPTVCMGYTGTGIIFGRKYSQAECNAFLKQELIHHSTGLLKCINKPLKENEYNAYTLFTYNVGIAGACSSRAIRLFNEGKNVDACRALSYGPTGDPAWSYAGGKFVKGLHNRRIYEMKMCLGNT